MNSKCSFKLVVTAIALFLYLPLSAQFMAGGGGTTILQNIGDRVGIGVATPNTINKLEILAPTLTYGGGRAVDITTQISGTNIIGQARSILAGGSAWHAVGSMYGAIGQSSNVTTLNAPFGNKNAYAVGGLFTSNANNLSSSVVAGSNVRFAGALCKLSGNISTFPALSQDAIAAAVIAEDDINTSDTYAGYFKGRSVFTDQMRISGGSLTSAGMLDVGNGDGDGITVYASSRGGYIEGYRVGAVGIGGTHILGGTPVASETFGLWGTSGGVSNVNSVGVHGDGIGSQYAMGVWGAGYAGTIATYGVFGETPSGGGATYAGYFDGDVHATGTVTWTSDKKLKKDINEIEGAVAKVNELAPKEYHFKTEEFSYMGLPTEKSYGFLAHELEEVFPEMVENTILPPRFDDEGNMTNDKLEYKSVNYIALIPVLTKAIQEQTEVIDALNAKIEALEEQVNVLSGDNTISKDTESSNENFSISQNQPNPFDDKTTISLYLPVTVSDAQLIITDMSGKLITTKPIPQRGETTVEIDASQYQAGMYIYSLSIDNNIVSSKKMLLRKDH